ncbi:MAG: DNA adenine methylase [Cypionkella sp.]
MTASKSPAGHFTPLRYPGGKGKIARFVADIVLQSGLSDGLYVEPYAGGAAVALELLLQGKVSRICLNDISLDVYSFWHSVLNETADLCRLIEETPRTVESWDLQKSIHRSGTEDKLALGFATFFLNRTNRSGILNAGIIGGRAQMGDWKIDARYNAAELVRRVQAIASQASRISVSNLDAIEFLRQGVLTWPERTLVYLDPPYYVKGRDLYHHHYRHPDHIAVREAVSLITRQRWIVSYDDVVEIDELYRGERRLRYGIGYSARDASSGREVMFFGNDVAMPPCCPAMTEIERSDDLARSLAAE